MRACFSRAQMRMCSPCRSWLNCRRQKRQARRPSPVEPSKPKLLSTSSAYSGASSASTALSTLCVAELYPFRNVAGAPEDTSLRFSAELSCRSNTTRCFVRSAFSRLIRFCSPGQLLMWILSDARKKGLPHPRHDNERGKDRKVTVFAAGPQ